MSKLKIMLKLLTTKEWIVCCDEDVSWNIANKKAWLNTLKDLKKDISETI